MILFAWRRLPPPGFIGGAEISEGLVARSLATAGEPVTFLGSITNPRDPSESWQARLLTLLDHHRIPYDVDGDHLTYRWDGVECHAVPQDQLLRTVHRFAGSAELLWTSQEDCPTIRAVAAGLPAASYAHSVSDIGLLSAQLDATWVFAPSRFVQRVIHDRFGVRAHLLRPPLEPVPVDVPDVRSRSLVLFVNPIRDKGVEMAVEMARRFPSTPFAFVESWRPANSDLTLPRNVELLGRMPAPTFTSLYRHTRLLVVPSVLDDACPRVVLEAGAHGVPALGSDRGGIPELIADGRNVLLATDADAWAARCGELLQSASAWSAASAEQREVAHRLRTDPVTELAEVGFPLTGQAARK